MRGCSILSDLLPITPVFRSFLLLLSGTATGLVVFVIVNKSEILCVKRWEETVKGRALVELE